MDSPFPFFLISLKNGPSLRSSPNTKVWRAKNRNYRLILEGHVFKIAGETVISLSPEDRATRLIELYALHKAEGIRKVSGDFTLTVLSDDGIFCYRSPLSPHSIFFSQEATSNSLLPIASLQNQAELNETYAAKFLTKITPLHFHSPETPLKGIRRLGPGMALEWAGRRWIEKSMGRAPSGPPRLDNSQKKEDAAEQIQSLMKQSVANRLNFHRDRPVVCEVSGGLDSSFVAALAARNSSSVTGYMYSFPEYPSHKTSEDLARKVALENGITLTVLAPNDLQIAPLSERLPYRDEPFEFFWQGHLFGRTVSELIPQNALVLNGIGADQLFIQYPPYLPFLLKNGHFKKYFKSLKEMARATERTPFHLFYQTLLASLPPLFLADLSLGSKKTFKTNFFSTMEILPEITFYEPIDWVLSEKMDSGLKNLLQADSSHAPFAIEKGGLHADSSYAGVAPLLMGPYFQEKNAICVSPYCDELLTNYVREEVSLHLIHDWAMPSKNLLREAQRGILSEEIRLRPKGEFCFDGFLNQWVLNNETFLRSLLTEKNVIYDWGWISKMKVQRCIDPFFFGVRDHSTTRLLHLIAFLLWWRDFRSYLQQMQASPPHWLSQGSGG